MLKRDKDVKKVFLEECKKVQDTCLLPKGYFDGVNGSDCEPAIQEHLKGLESEVEKQVKRQRDVFFQEPPQVIQMEVDGKASTWTTSKMEKPALQAYDAHKEMRKGETKFREAIADFQPSSKKPLDALLAQWYPLPTPCATQPQYHSEENDLFPNDLIPFNQEVPFK